ncbi:hypothetical protein [Pseudomonas sp. EA_105y_Pfl2_R69]|uniref:hypothetical protein n=1 Tax=Pseudomonas sp. EA_105y_Pfl2_R69 TaxID=3088683 RepID=UPI0030DD3371
MRSAARRNESRSYTLAIGIAAASGADLSQADGDMSFSASKEADLYLIRAGQERYEIPEALVFGG